MIFKLRLDMTAGGRTANEVFDNEMLYHLDGDLTDPRHRLIAAGVGNAFQAILIRQVRILGAHITDEPERDYKRPKDQYISVGITASGTHGAAEPLLLPAPLTYCAHFEKDPAVGRSGKFDVRACYYDQDTITGPDLNPTTVTAYDGAHLAGFGAALLAVFTAKDAQMCLRAPSDKDWLTDWKPIVGIPYTGLSQHQLYNSSKSVPEGLADLFLREAKAIANEIANLLKHAIGGELVPATLAYAINKIKNLILRYGISKVAAFEWPAGVEAIAALALAA